MRARTVGFVCFVSGLVGLLTGGCSKSGGGSTAAGGSGDDASSPGVVGCGIVNINATCNACLETSCCSEAQACAGDPACANLVDCLTGALLTDGGVQACDEAAGATALGEYTSFQSCLQTTCSVSCPSCHGIPASCDSHFDETSCSSAGCLWSGTCGGTSLGCLDLDQFQCGATLGCYYDSTTMVCSGSTPSCDSNISQLACTDETGCVWTAGCTGISSVLCSVQTNVSACISAGCVWN
jgi:hypothetical protein